MIGPHNGEITLGVHGHGRRVLRIRGAAAVHQEGVHVGGEVRLGERRRQGCRRREIGDRRLVDARAAAAESHLENERRRLVLRYRSDRHTRVAGGNQGVLNGQRRGAKVGAVEGDAGSGHLAARHGHLQLEGPAQWHGPRGGEGQLLHVDRGRRREDLDAGGDLAGHIGAGGIRTRDADRGEAAGENIGPATLDIVLAAPGHDKVAGGIHRHRRLVLVVNDRIERK